MADPFTNAKINRNFEVFSAADFLAAISQHIPDKGTQIVRYCGWSSNKMRGVHQRGLPPELVVRQPGQGRLSRIHFMSSQVLKNKC
jgi:hypothetical protein